MFFLSWLRSKLATRIYHCNRKVGGAPLLLINLGEAPMEPGLWLCAWLASASDCPVEVFDWPLPTNELLSCKCALSGMVHGKDLSFCISPLALTYSPKIINSRRRHDMTSCCFGMYSLDELSLQKRERFVDCQAMGVLPNGKMICGLF